MSSCYLTPEDVRTYLVDSSPDDNELLDDIDFTPGQIKLAMRMAANSFNDMPPLVARVDADHLPLTDWAMMAVQEHLFKMRLNQLERNAFVLEAGNTGFDEDNARIKNLRSALPRMEIWRQIAGPIKTAYNASITYGDLG